MRRHTQGFTLLELLIVLGIFGLFAAMAYGGLNFVLTSRQRLEASMADLADWQRSFQKLRNDFQLMSLRSVRNGSNLSEPPLRFDEFDARVEFTRSSWRNPLKAARPSLERVIVRYDDDEKTLLRETYGVLDRAQDEVAAGIVLLRNVTEVRWRFLDANREWQDRWPPASVQSAAALGAGTLASSATAAPLAVELNISADGMPGVRWLFRVGESLAPVTTAGTGPASAANPPTDPTPITPAPPANSGTNTGTPPAGGTP